MVRSGLFFLGSVALVACSDPSAAPVSASLDAPARITASAPNAASQIEVSIPGSDGAVTMTLPVRALKLGLHTGATPAIDMLQIPVGDIDIAAATLPPDGLSLRGVVLSIPQSLPVKVEHMQGDAIEMRVQTQLRMNWSKVEADGSVVELQPVPSEALQLSVQVLLENGVPTTVVTAGKSLYVESAASVDLL